MRSSDNTQCPVLSTLKLDVEDFALVLEICNSVAGRTVLYMTKLLSLPWHDTRYINEDL